MSSFIVFGSASRSVDENSSTLSLPNDKPIRVYVDCTVHGGNFAIYIEEQIGNTWFPLASSTITGTGQTTFVAPAPKTAAKIRVRYDVVAGSATAEIRLAIADDVSRVGHASIPLASAARQADANSDPLSLPADSNILMYVDVTAGSTDDTAVVNLQEQVNSKWYTLASVSIAAATTGQFVAEAAGPRSGGPIRVNYDHTEVGAAENITAEVRLAA